MTDLVSIAAGLFTNPTYGIPVLVLSVVTLFWLATHYGHLPPQFRPIGPDRSWMKSPYSWVEEGLAADQIVPAVAYASYRVHEALRLRFGVISTGAGSLWSMRRRVPAEALALIVAARRLDTIYRLSRLAESPFRDDLISRWRRPSWRRQSRAMFAATLDELERMLPPLESAS